MRPPRIAADHPDRRPISAGEHFDRPWRQRALRGLEQRKSHAALHELGRRGGGGRLVAQRDGFRIALSFAFRLELHD
jgi:hypothetical protein